MAHSPAQKRLARYGKSLRAELVQNFQRFAMKQGNAWRIYLGNIRTKALDVARKARALVQRSHLARELRAQFDAWTLTQFTPWALYLCPVKA